MSHSYSPPFDLDRHLQNLHVFSSVAQAKSIAHAAQDIFKAASAVTRSVIALERSLGVPLFERKRRGMLLTGHGTAVLVRARRIEEEIQLAAEEFLRSKAKSSGVSRGSIQNLLLNGRKLQLLIQVADLRNISSAAAHLNMTQAGASMALSRMEAALGEFLFQRRMQGMVPTEAAEHLVMHARRVFAELRHLAADISALSGTVTGSVIIGTTPLGRTTYFTTAIEAAIDKYPYLRVTTVENLYEQLIASLRSGDIDIVFGVLRPKELSQGLITEPLFKDRLSILVRAGHPLTQRSQLRISDLLSEKWILPRPNALARPQIEQAFHSLGLPPPIPSVETGDLSILGPLLRTSDMLAVTSPVQFVFELQSKFVAELPVELDDTGREVGFIVREGAMLSPAALAVIECVRSQLRAHQGHA